MELYDKPQALPVLKVEKLVHRLTVEEDDTVCSLIKSQLLLDKQFNTIYLEVLKKSEKMMELFSQFNEENEFFHPSMLSRFYKTKDFRKYMTLRHIWPQRPEGLKPKEREKYNKEMREAKKDLYSTIKREITSHSKQINNMLSAFEKERCLDLNILSSTTLYSCKKCGYVVSKNKFRVIKCSCGADIELISSVEQIPVSHFNTNLIQFLKHEYWLEHGVDYLLRKKNYQTIVGYYVLGSSGIRHEIDNIASSRSGNYRFFCECKKSDINVADVFIFAGKMADIGCTRGYFFTNSNNISAEVMALARSKNIKIIFNILEKDTQNLLGEIREE
jgi:rubrerythrin